MIAGLADQVIGDVPDVALTRFNLDTFDWSVSKPRTANPLSAKARANGSPTYPKPMTPMRAFFAAILAPSDSKELGYECAGT